MPPRLARLLAVVVAVGLVAGAIAVRTAINGDDEGDPVTAGAGGGDGDDGDDGPTGPYRVVCDEDLGDACTALGRVLGEDRVTTLRADEVLGAAADGSLDADAWLTLDPMPEVLETAWPGSTSGAQVEAASSALVLLTFDESGVACEEWTCLAEAAAQQDVGVPALTSSAGLVTSAGAYVGVAGRQEVEDGGIRALEGEVEDALRDLRRRGGLADQSGQFVTQRGTYDGIVTTAGLADLRIRNRPAEGLARRDLSPEVVVGVVLAGLGPDGQEAVETLDDLVARETVVDALAAAGWTGGATPSTGLPDPDVIYALREELGS